MTTARYLVGDVYERLAEVDDGSVDVAISSPPFLALRSYLPDSHPDKAREIGSEGTPAAFIDVLLEWTAAVGRVLAPHGSLVVELGDTYAGSGGAGGDYDPDGRRAGQPAFGGSGRLARHGDDRGNPAGMRDTTFSGANTRSGGGDEWPLPKSLAGIPQAYQLSLAYGHNVLTGAPSPAGRWIIRNVKPWIRSNPPVGELGDKERPATSYVIVATRARARYFDLDAVRTRHSEPIRVQVNREKLAAPERGSGGDRRGHILHTGIAVGAPPRDWWHHVDAVLDAELDRRAGRLNGGRGPTVGTASASRGVSGGDSGNPDKPRESGGATIGARGVHLRRALERAGILTTVDALDVSPKGYAGAHYAVWPPELVRLLLAEMCPARVCTTCGHPSRRLVAAEPSPVARADRVQRTMADAGRASIRANGKTHIGIERRATTTGWSDCGHGTWRPGMVLDSFAGSGTTLAVASGMGFDSIGIDLDYRNAALALERVGMFLDVWWSDHNGLPAIGPGSTSRAAYRPWLHLMDHVARHVLAVLLALQPGARPGRAPDPEPPARRAPRSRAITGQTDLFTPTPP